MYNTILNSPGIRVVRAGLAPFSSLPRVRVVLAEVGVAAARSSSSPLPLPPPIFARDVSTCH